MAENLYNLVQNQMKSDSGKTKLGYTVTQYSSVLGALQQSKFIIKKIVQQNGGGGTAGTFDSSSGLSFGAQYSTYGQQKFSIKMQSGTFWTDQKQGLCKVNSYMSFPVKMDTNTYHVPYEKPFAQFQYGNTLCGKSTFPPTLMEFVTNTSYTADYIIGIGLDFQRFVLPYFEHFYGAESGWKDKNDTIRNIAKERKLHAEILFPHGSTSVNDKEGASGSFFIIHVPVVIDYNSENDSFFVMYFPAPLLLLNSFNQGGKLGSVQVKLGEKSCKVGQQATFPFSGNHYNHTSGTITGYNQQAYKALKTNDGGVSATQITVSFPKGVNTDCFIRLFFDKSVESQLGLAITDEALKQQLFKSAYNPSDLVKREVIQGGQFIGASLMEVLQNVVNKIKAGNPSSRLTPDGLLRALTTIGMWEGGGIDAWDYWGIVSEATHGRPGKDTAGYNAGQFSFTEASGGISKLMAKIKSNMQPSNPYYTKIDGIKSRADGKRNWLLTKADGEVFKEMCQQYKDLVMKSTVQCLFDEDWGKKALTTILNQKITSPLGIAATIAHGIWKPAYVINDYKEAGIAGVQDEVTKVQYAGATFLKRGLVQLGRLKSTDTIQSIIAAVLSEQSIHPRNHTNDVAKRIKATYGGWYTRAANIILHANDTEINNQKQFSY